MVNNNTRCQSELCTRSHSDVEGYHPRRYKLLTGKPKSSFVEPCVISKAINTESREWSTTCQRHLKTSHHQPVASHLNMSTNTHVRIGTKAGSRLRLLCTDSTSFSPNYRHRQIQVALTHCIGKTLFPLHTPFAFCNVTQ